MDPKKIQSLLDAVASGTINSAKAMEQLKNMPFEDLNFAKLDHHRSLRKGYPETIFCSGKTTEQVVKITESMHSHGSNVLGTRCTPEQAEAVCKKFPDATYHEAANAITLYNHEPEKLPGYIGVICAGTSDIPVAEEAVVTLESMGNNTERIYDIGVAGLQRLMRFQDKFHGATVLIVCAGMEGALPSVIGGLVECPVIAVPTSVGYGASFNGLAALLGMLNTCASGVTVVNIDNGFGAAASATAINRMIHRNNR